MRRKTKQPMNQPTKLKNTFGEGLKMFIIGLISVNIHI